MKLIFCKSTENRRRKFQIYTCIYQLEDEKKYVIKKAVFADGVEHIEKMCTNYHLLYSLHQDCVITCDRVEDGIRFPYIEGDTYAQQLKEKLLQNESVEYWKKVLNEWKQLLIGKQENLTEFDNSAEFQKVFGDAGQLRGDVALKITNFDCIGENIIVTEKKLQIIDYEWVFDFPIPLNFCFFRILRQFSMDSNGCFDLERLLAAADITDRKKIQIYERLLDNFDLYVSYDEEKNISYASLGKIFKQPQIFSQDDRKMKFTFPADRIKKGSRIVIYGAGDVGMSFYQHLQGNEGYRLVKWIDKKYEQYREYGYDVCEVQSVVEQEYDFILIAIYNENIAKEISNELKGLGIEDKKIIWVKPQYA